MRRAGAAAAGDQREVLVFRPTVGQQRGEERDGDEREDEDETENRRRISDQPPEGVVPEPAGRLVETDFLGFDLGEAHEYRVLGLMKAYETSTIRFTRTKTIARERIAPWRTG